MCFENVVERALVVLRLMVRQQFCTQKSETYEEDVVGVQGWDLGVHSPVERNGRASVRVSGISPAQQYE